MVAAVTRQTQGLLLAFLGTVLLRLSVSDTYLRYVTEWMKWPILASGVVMILLAIGPIFIDPDNRRGDRTEDHAHAHEGHSGVPRATWLLLLPGLITFVISPPELGSFLAERRANQSAAAEPGTVAALTDGGTTPLALQDFVWRAQSGGGTLADRSVSLTGFVSHDGDRWFVTRLTIGCCAADALAFRVEVDADAPRPDRDQWVTVTGEYVEGSGASVEDDPVIAADEVVEIDKPRQTYE
jgi:uncharacterized repeat protein (TIGR03943 family)